MRDSYLAPSGVGILSHGLAVKNLRVCLRTPVVRIGLGGVLKHTLHHCLLLTNVGCSVRIGLVQHACGCDPGENLEKAIRLIKQAAEQGAQLVVTQELFTLRYFPQEENSAHFDLAEPVPGPTSHRLGRLAGRLGIALVASLFEKRGDGIYHNTAVLIDGTPPRREGQIIGLYRKMHLPHDPKFFEKYYFTPGDTSWQVHRAAGAAVGMLICWDQWFPEAARLATLRGAQVLLYPSAIGWTPDDAPRQRQQQFEAWQIVQRAHAVSNGVFLAAINRVGTEGDLTFWGASFIVDPTGQIIARADENHEQVLIADCDLGLIEAQRRQWPFLRDRRADRYGDLTKQYIDEWSP